MGAEAFLDDLEVNAPYQGVVARAYDVFLPPGKALPDDAVHTEMIRQAGGVALELGVGNGRFLVPRLEEGLAVEGVDNATDMLHRCRLHLDARGLDATLHQGDMSSLHLPATYTAICATAGSMMLLDDERRVRAALSSCWDHLEPGGRLAVSMSMPGEDEDTGWAWRLRRTGSDERGTTYVVHEATEIDQHQQLVFAYNRLEVLDPAGTVTEVSMRKQRLRWWRPDQLAALFDATGFEDVAAVDAGSGWVTVGRRA
jgi:SAM-dependent methyltransferase